MTSLFTFVALHHGNRVARNTARYL